MMFKDFLGFTASIGTITGSSINCVNATDSTQERLFYNVVLRFKTGSSDCFRSFKILLLTALTQIQIIVLVFRQVILAESCCQ
jgi:hypothetical protein